MLKEYFLEKVSETINYLAEKNSNCSKELKNVLKKVFYSLIDFMEKAYQETSALSSVL